MWCNDDKWWSKIYLQLMTPLNLKKLKLIMSPLLRYNIYVVKFFLWILHCKLPCSLTAVIDRSCNPPSHDAIPWRLCEVCIYFNRYEIPPSPYPPFSSLRLSYPSRTQTQTDTHIYTNTRTLLGASELICAMRMVQYQPPHLQPPMEKCYHNLQDKYYKE